MPIAHKITSIQLKLPTKRNEIVSKSSKPDAEIAKIAEYQSNSNYTLDVKKKTKIHISFQSQLYPEAKIAQNSRHEFQLRKKNSHSTYKTKTKSNKLN
jgi:hypothetical protein